MNQNGVGESGSTQSGGFSQAISPQFSTVLDQLPET